MAGFPGVYSDEDPLFRLWVKVQAAYQHAGSPTLRQLADDARRVRAGCLAPTTPQVHGPSHTSVGHLLNAERVLSWNLTEPVLLALGADVNDIEPLWSAAHQVRGAPTQALRIAWACAAAVEGSDNEHDDCPATVLVPSPVPRRLSVRPPPSIPPSLSSVSAPAEDPTPSSDSAASSDRDAPGHDATDDWTWWSSTAAPVPSPAIQRRRSLSLVRLGAAPPNVVRARLQAESIRASARNASTPAEVSTTVVRIVDVLTAVIDHLEQCESGEADYLLYCAVAVVLHDLPRCLKSFRSGENEGSWARLARQLYLIGTDVEHLATQVPGLDQPAEGLTEEVQRRYVASLRAALVGSNTALTDGGLGRQEVVERPTSEAGPRIGGSRRGENAGAAERHPEAVPPPPAEGSKLVRPYVADIAEAAAAVGVAAGPGAATDPGSGSGLTVNEQELLRRLPPLITTSSGAKPGTPPLNWQSAPMGPSTPPPGPCEVCAHSRDIGGCGFAKKADRYLPCIRCDDRTRGRSRCGAPLCTRTRVRNCRAVMDLIAARSRGEINFNPRG